jgi:hypothetical protein
MCFVSRFLMVRLVSFGSQLPTRLSMPSCSQPSRTLRAADAVARRRAILDRRCARRHGPRAGRDGRMVPIEQKDWTRRRRAAGLPTSASGSYVVRHINTGMWRSPICGAKLIPAMFFLESTHPAPHICEATAIAGTPSHPASGTSPRTPSAFARDPTSPMPASWSRDRSPRRCWWCRATCGRARLGSC